MEQRGRGTNCTVSKIFIDTNILVYTVDKNAPKSVNALGRHASIVETHQPVISTQVINEFYIVATKKLHAEPIIVKNIIHNFETWKLYIRICS